MSNQDRGVEVRDLITHLQTLDPTARMVFTTDGYTDTPVCTSDFVRQASGAVEVVLLKPIIEKGFKDEIEELETEVDQLESQIKSKDERIENLVSALATIRRVSSEVLGS